MKVPGAPGGRGIRIHHWGSAELNGSHTISNTPCAAINTSTLRAARNMSWSLPSTNSTGGCRRNSRGDCSFLQSSSPDDRIKGCWQCISVSDISRERAGDASGRSGTSGQRAGLFSISATSTEEIEEPFAAATAGSQVPPTRIRDRGLSPTVQRDQDLPGNRTSMSELVLRAP